MTINLGGQLARVVLLIRTWYIFVVHLSARPWRERSYFRAFWSPDFDGDLEDIRGSFH